jgi:hypothetical protein
MTSPPIGAPPGMVWCCDQCANQVGEGCTCWDAALNLARAINTKAS